MKLIPDIREDVLQKSKARAHSLGIVLPTIAQQKDPALIPQATRTRLADVGLWDIDPVNLFRITWKNEPVAHGGAFGDGNWIEFPPELTGVDATIVGIVVGAQVPAEWSLDFAIALVFLGLLAPAVSTKPAAVAALVGGVVAVLTLELPNGTGIIVASLAGVAAGSLAEWRLGR